MASSKNFKANQAEPLEKKLGKAAEKLQAIKSDHTGVDPEDKDEYKAENVYFVPTKTRWPYLVAKARQPDIGLCGNEATKAPFLTTLTKMKSNTKQVCILEKLRDTPLLTLKNGEVRVA